MKKSATAITLVMINVAAIGSLNNLPSLATAGLSSVSYYLIAALLFFVPYSLISAELSSAYTTESGIYVWVKEAFGRQWGFIAIWLQWLENIFWYPTILSFIAATLCHFIDPALASNKTYNVVSTLGIYWLLTGANLLGIRASNLISVIGSSIGILIPGVILIILGLAWFGSGHSTTLTLHWKDLAPDLHGIQNLAFLVGIAQTLAGLEMSSVHAGVVKNPQRAYPLAILISALVVCGLSVFGSLAIAALVPAHLIDINDGVTQAVMAFFQHQNVYVTDFIIALIVIGGMTAANAWISGPSSGLVQAAEDKCIPKYFKKANAQGASMPVLITQGLLVSVFCGAFALMPTVTSAYWLLTAIAGQLYLAMYVLMFAAAIKLRRKKDYHYKIGGVKTTVSIALFGGMGCIAFICIGFIPPASLNITGFSSYYIIQASAFIVMLLLPVFIFKLTQNHYAKNAKLAVRAYRNDAIMKDNAAIPLYKSK
ncbi:MAG: amino acid permease [Gammaproteobacteria bacterium]|nr:amino acid permease [Gammaproteobacteria bacterium]